MSCPAPATIAVTEGALPDGRNFGFVHHFDGAALYVDPAEYFSGEEAVRAAREDGELASGEDLPNPYYIRNRDTAIVRVAVSSTLAVTMLDNQEVAARTLTAREFAALYCETAKPSWLYSDPDNVPMDLRVSKSQVVRADEQYVP